MFKTPREMPNAKNLSSDVRKRLSGIILRYPLISEKLGTESYAPPGAPCVSIIEQTSDPNKWAYDYGRLRQRLIKSEGWPPAKTDLGTRGGANRINRNE